MNSEIIKRVDSIAVSIAVSGVDNIPIQRPYVMHPTGMLQPARVDIRWENGELVKLTVSGRKLKTDGRLGLAESTTHFVWYSVIQQHGRPDWLDMLVQQHAPRSVTMR